MTIRKLESVKIELESYMAAIPDEWFRELGTETGSEPRRPTANNSRCS